MSMRDVLVNCLGNSYKRESLEKLINKCHHLALAYLRMKAASKKLFMVENERLEDLAWDFIADLFEKNDEDQLIKLQEYFAAIPLLELSEAEVLIELRKLVFTKVEDNIFRAFGEHDPSLRKIIRNIKIAIRDNKCDGQVSYKDGYLVLDGDKDQPLDENLPMISSEFLQFKLSPKLDESMNIPEIVNETVKLLQQQSIYQKRVAVVALATVIRSAFVEFHDPASLVQKFEADKRLVDGEFKEFLEKSIDRVRNSTGHSYVKRGKVTEEQLEIYLSAAEEIIYDHFTSGKREVSQFEYLKNYIDGLEYEEFRSEKRQVLEYIVRVVKRDVVATFKEDWI